MLQLLLCLFLAFAASRFSLPVYLDVFVCEGAPQHTHAAWSPLVSLATDIEPKLERYKFAVQVYIGELKKEVPGPPSEAVKEGGAPFNPGVT